jgi:hypothetical protein
MFQQQPRQNTGISFSSAFNAGFGGAAGCCSFFLIVPILLLTVILNSCNSSSSYRTAEPADGRTAAYTNDTEESPQGRLKSMQQALLSRNMYVAAVAKIELSPEDPESLDVTVLDYFINSPIEQQYQVAKTINNLWFALHPNSRWVRFKSRDGRWLWQTSSETIYNVAPVLANPSP